MGYTINGNRKRMGLPPIEKEKSPSKSMSEVYVELLEDQVKQASEWLMNNRKEVVKKIKGISDFQIVINLRNGDTVPTIKVIQENVFYQWGDKR